MAKRRKHVELAKPTFTSDGLHSALRYFGYTTNNQTADIVELIMFAVERGLDNDQLYSKAERIWELEHGQS